MDNKDGHTIDSAPTSEPERPSEVRFIYQKARHHRTLHADGAWAGITPQMEVQFAFFNDLRPMPDEVIHAITADGSVGPEVSRVHQPLNIVRETDVTVVMNIAVMRNVLNLLTTMVEQIESRLPKDMFAVESAKVLMGETDPKEITPDNS